jgi:hypothetical protein
MLFVGSFDGKIYGLKTSDGSLVWSYQTGDRVVSSPAVVDGVVYVGSYDHSVYAIGALQQQSPDSTFLFMLLLTVSIGLIVALVVVGVFYWRRRREERFFGKYFMPKNSNQGEPQ